MTSIVNHISEKEYRELNAVSYSSLSKLAKSPQAYKLSEEAVAEEDTSAMALGSVVDILLTDKEKFDSEVYVMTANKPDSEMMLTYCRVYAETGNSASAHTASGYKISQSAVATKFDKEGRHYYDALITGQGKIIIDSETLFTANTIVKELTENPFTKKYFVKEDGVDLLFQVPIEWNIHFTSLTDNKPSVMKAKSLLDIIRVDHYNKVIQPVDLKTGGEGFMKSYWRYARYLQGAMYTDATMFASWDKPEIAQEYAIQCMKFVYADTNLFYSPVIYNMTPKDVHAGRSGIDYIEPIDVAKIMDSHIGPEGGVDTVYFATLGQTKRKGYQRLAAELDWHINNDVWNYNYDTYVKGAEVEINAFGVKL